MKKQEIIESRTGGFGGSDAHIFLKVGKYGITSLTDSDKKRIAVAMGQVEYEPIQPTKAMEAGNQFEHFLENYFFPETVINNYTLRGLRCSFEGNEVEPGSFKIFAHADFFYRGEVHEAKYTTADVKTTIKNYYAQLQWYYLFKEVKTVSLIKGTAGRTFDEIEEVEIKRDETAIYNLLIGIHQVDKFCNDFQYKPKDILNDFSLKGDIRSLSERLRKLIVMQNSISEKIDILKSNIKKSMEEGDIKKLDYSDMEVVYVGTSFRSNFDIKKFKSDNPGIDFSVYEKGYETKPFIKIKIKE